MVEQNRPTSPIDEVTVENAGRIVSGWTSVSVSRGLDRLAGSFSLAFPRTARARANSTAGDTASRYLSPIIPGRGGVRILLGGDAVLWGYVDSVQPGTDENAGTVQVVGRSVTADLADCSAMNEPGQWQNAALADVVAAIAAPFGLVVDNRAGRIVVKNFELESGERAFGAIERVCRSHGFVLHDSGSGAVVIDRPTGVAAEGALNYLFGPDGGPDPANNVLNTAARITLAGRFSEIIVRGQDAGTDTSFGADAAGVEGRAQDGGVTRYRPLIIAATGRVDGKSAREQAQWEVSRRIGQGLELTHVVRGWRQQKNGELWIPGLKVPVRDASAGVFADMLVTEVEWSVDGTVGRQTRLTLQSPAAFTPKPVSVGADALGQWDYAGQQVVGAGEQ